ncbi:hypothetical protein RUM44_014016 [Polyplax serrata]|uniref:Cytochrome P450 n=1 Tax=Polyplax serrata TaxID=468196 RepID=A0ABR1BKF7_POLSC
MLDLAYSILMIGLAGTFPWDWHIQISIGNNHPNEKVVGWYKLLKPAIIIRDPNLARRILVSDFHSFRNNDMELDPDVDPVLGNNLFLLNDEKWKLTRALLTPAFTAGKIKAIYPTMGDVVLELIKYLKRHPEELHVKHTMARYTAEIAARCALGIQGDNFKEPTAEMHEMGKTIFQSDTMNNLKFILFVVLPRISKLLGLKMVSSKVYAFFNGILRDVIVYRQNNHEVRNDFVQFLLDVKKKSLDVANGVVKSETHTKVYTDQDVLAGCIMFFVESFETTSLLLTHILYFLAKHKHIQDKVRKEAEEALRTGELTFEKLNELPYLNSVLLVCTERFQMDIGKAKPIVIEKGTPTVIPIYAIQNDPAYWEDPKSFKPERFMKKEDVEAKSKGIYLPFGDGPRMCPGSRVAITIIKLAVVHILTEMEVLTSSKTPKEIDYDPTYFLLSHKGGIHLKFAERN